MGKPETKVRGQEKVDRLLAEVHHLKTAYVTIGIHKDAGKYEDGTDVVEVALWNEFGTRNIPERSFFRSTMDENVSKINAWREAAVDKILRGGSVEEALRDIGFKIMVLIQNKIKSNVPPPLAPSTVRAKEEKGRPPVTLIDSGLMLRSVSFRVVMK